MDLVIVVICILNLLWLLTLTIFIIIRFRKKPQLSVQKVQGFHYSLVKFNPFSDTGGEQSFVVSLLDGGGNGILLTSLNGRGISRFYAKRVVAGKPDLELSAEEKQALTRALNQKPVEYHE